VSERLQEVRSRLKGQRRLPKETIVIYRQVFQRDDAGRLVLVWLIERCGLMKRVDTEEQRVLHNWGIEMLENMGMTQGPNYRALVDAMLKLGIPDEAVEE